MTTHTKGQWFLDIDKNDGSGKWDYYIRESSGSDYLPDRHIATLNGYLRNHDGQTKGVNENAALIIAAPQLLEALEDMLQVFGCHEPDFPIYKAKADKARAAIAKAKGEA